MNRPNRALVVMTIPDGEATEVTSQRITVIAERLKAAQDAAAAEVGHDDRAIAQAISNWWQGDYHAGKAEFSAATASYVTALHDFMSAVVRQFGKERVAGWERTAAAIIEGYNREAGIINAEQEIKHGNSSVH